MAKVNLQNTKNKALPVIDWVAKLGAALFFIACTYGYVANYIKAHQGQHDLSVAGAILVVSVALYLFGRRKQ